MFATPEMVFGHLVSLLSGIFTSPLNVILVILCAVLTHLLLKSDKSSKNAENIKTLPPMEKHDMTLEELSKYDGKGPDGRICIALNGFVYDVTKSPHYKPGQHYSSLAGRDATRSLAKFDLALIKDEWDDTSDLTSNEMSSVREWEIQFSERYDKVGKLVKTLESKEIEVEQ